LGQGKAVIGTLLYRNGKMKQYRNTLYQNTMIGLRYKHWTYSVAFAYFLKGVARELKIAPRFWENNYYNTYFRAFKKRWLVRNGNASCFDIQGAKLPDLSGDKEKMNVLVGGIFEDTFFIPAFFNDNYDKSIVELVDKYMNEGPYGYYIDDNFDVTVKSGDVVIDAGAWIGDFSAYAVSKGATVYAFEPVKETFDWLCTTAELNGKKLHPVQKGLSKNEEKAVISIDADNSGGNSIVRENSAVSETINLTTLDKFVEENNLTRIDFIKADIEGAERDMLRGATNVLKTFAPKLAICTYHLPDDPEVLEQIIKEANPKYKVVHIRKKLFAACI
jgi:FkbM family methyltransferase